MFNDNGNELEFTALFLRHWPKNVYATSMPVFLFRFATTILPASWL